MAFLCYEIIIAICSLLRQCAMHYNIAECAVMKHKMSMK